ncbi:cyclopropane-fatty-acyl-phospholipid synthase [Roseovarius atlanticus]|uniref:Cyclopropane-fatty-acyl-phospholipid synthase n=1 Tax=Roseovarius atlanticus TaxID=1641875 RepID=A0A0T5NR52_9RHOB|nr:cyclopropane-fatty-acyl-phospholipid synthase family protein [Roseovarius atlanticus]KRS11421.1 cyclopropane-fatty-acyl-phospholipid synthase [Roseovarius atlanticus]
MWTKMLDVFVTHLFRKGDFSLTYPDGTTRRYGDGGTPSVAMTLHDPTLPRKIILSPELAVGEGYMDGTLTLADDDLRGFLSLAVDNIARQGSPWFHRPLDLMRHAGRWLKQFNPAKRSKANVAHHYDLSGELYDLFLDKDRQYSCAYFARPDMTLEEAQEAKKHHIARKLLLKPGMRVLDIGCGWGGMALTLARDYGVTVVGVTLSEEQHALATRRAAEAGLSDKVQFHLMDYRAVTGTFDRIVSVGMFEHVGVPHYREYFRTVHDLLAEDGVALIHTIGHTDPPGTTNPWILKYIFPGGYCPALSEATRAIEVNDLHSCDIEVWRLHYAETLCHWYDRFMANIDRARELYDDRFCRMWRYYLLACEATFRYNSQVVFQFQLSRRQDAVPLTRDYLYSDAAAEELRHAAE